VEDLITPKDVVFRFVSGINRHDPDGLASLMTEDHTFVDSLGHAVRGRDPMREGWKAYFAFCRNYWIAYEKLIDNGNHVALFGTAGGTIVTNGTLPPENEWRTPAAWLAVVEGGLVKEWRVYADNKPVYDILAGMEAANR